jgi:hypothetical protein
MINLSVKTIVKHVFLQYSDNLFIPGCRIGRDCVVVVWTSPYIVYNRCPSVHCVILY